METVPALATRQQSIISSKTCPIRLFGSGGILRGTLAEWCAEKGIGEEETLEIEYFESVMPPQRMSTLPHEDWVSSISCQIAGYFLTACYDGNIRAFDYSQKLLQTIPTHNAPVSSICIIPTPSAPSESHLIASASHDLTARITRLTLTPDSSTASPPQTLASLHLHTAPLSSISANSSGTHVLTSSWDGLIGVWNTSIPTIDEVPLDDTQAGAERKRRRKMGDGDDAPRPRRKAPAAVLKSHTARVSKVVFGRAEQDKTAYSCGFDSTVRVWDVENEICTNTITASSKPFLDLALSPSGQSALAASTDRTVSQYDLRASTSSAITPSVATLAHPATPSCIAVSPDSSSEHQLITGAYDGVVRLWDLRSIKSAVTSFKAWEGKDVGKKVLSVDWARGGRRRR
ncbi:Ribosome biogenesis protein YTM1 [Grifola frondosa]|uniref:Ribosome biogenesis protein YTM1 n=1 Tax=Grifola frondosa TaxID=5627 RepID=A0A1C7MKS5_GRIFR|nr:Ribosome biogenesis protein YTM1 [Grifola frondosa]